MTDSLFDQGSLGGKTCRAHSLFRCGPCAFLEIERLNRIKKQAAAKRHEHDFSIPVWEPMPGTSPGFEQQLYCAYYRCMCGALRFGGKRK